MRKRKPGAMSHDNCVTKQISSDKKRALKSVEERNRWEKGKIVTKIPIHPRGFILKYE